MRQKDARRLLQTWFLGCGRAIESENFAEFLGRFDFENEAQCATVARVYMSALLTDRLVTALCVEVGSDPLHRFASLERQVAAGRLDRVLERFVIGEAGIVPKWYLNAISRASSARQELNANETSALKTQDLFHGGTIYDFVTLTSPEIRELCDREPRSDLLLPTLVTIKDESEPFKCLKLKFRNEQDFAKFRREFQKQYGYDLSESAKFVDIETTRLRSQ